MLNTEDILSNTTENSPARTDHSESYVLMVCVGCFPIAKSYSIIFCFVAQILFRIALCAL